jgi:hypothetical protein
MKKCDYCNNDAAIYSDDWAICGECPDTKPPDKGGNNDEPEPES